MVNREIIAVASPEFEYIYRIRRQYPTIGYLGVEGVALETLGSVNVDKGTYYPTDLKNQIEGLQELSEYDLPVNTQAILSQALHGVANMSAL